MTTQTATSSNSLRATLRSAFYAAAPRRAVAAYLNLRMMREAHRLVRLRERASEAHVWIDELMRSHFFCPLQKRSEVLGLVERLRALRPARVCEVGAAGGGTAFLFAHAAADDARLISIDLAFSRARRRAVSGFVREGQELICLEADSHRRETVEAVRAHLDGHKLDLLYLDGDHSYEGVKMDFQFYAPLVRGGGLIVLHDIVPDYMTRYGQRTRSDTGGVPRFWRELKARHTRVEEIVEDTEQDGFGIGILQADDADALSSFQ